MKTSNPIVAYLLALLFCGMAFSVALALDAPSSCFFLALTATTLFAGTRPACLSTLISTCLFEFYFLPPAGHLMHSRAAFVRLGLFVCAQLLTIFLIDSRRHSELSLLQLGQDLLTLARTSPDGILFLDTEHVILSVNPAFESLFGYGAAELVGHSVSRFFPVFPADLAPARSFVGEFTLPHKSGRPLEIDLTASPLGDKAALFLRDIGDRKRAQRRLEESELSLRLTLETIPGNVFIRAPDGQVVYANARLMEYLGKPLEEVLGFGWLDDLHPEDREPARAAIARFMAIGDPYSIDYRRRRFDGVYRWFNASVRPLRDSNGHVIRWYGLLTDIEDRLDMEASLRATQSRLAHATQLATASELAAAIVHEIGQPLSAMVANGHAAIRWLSASPPSLTDTRRALDRVVRDGKDAAEIIHGLRSLFRHAPLQPTRLDLAPIVVEVLSLLRTKAEHAAIPIDLDIPHTLPPILGDKIQLQQVLMNLISNGIESMHSSQGATPPRLTIRLAVDGPHVLTSIEDRGPGVPDFALLFEPFYTTKEKGMGMGLAICRSIVEAHHGRLWGSPAPVRGSIFSFTIPLLEADPT